VPIVVNFKICDNSPDCLGIVVCPTHAFYFDEKKRSLVVDNSKCINCGKCVSQCGVGAIHFAKTVGDLKKVKQEIDADPRKQSDLFVDRYGAEPQAKEFFCSPQRFDLQILHSTKPAVVECFDADSIHCLVYSIPIKELFVGKDIVYRKFGVDKKFKQKYKIDQLPAFLFFLDGKLKGKIEGYYSFDKKDELISKLNKHL